MPIRPSRRRQGDDTSYKENIFRKPVEKHFEGGQK